MERVTGTQGSNAISVSRRDVLKTVGGGAVGLTAMTGTASAWQIQFYGCSQVCSGSQDGRAVVAVDGGYECRPMGEYTSDRQNQDWKWSSSCYEVSGAEAIVGMIEGCASETFCLNPNNCASNYYDSVDEIIAALNDSGCCSGNIEPGECDVTGTGGGNDDNPGRGTRGRGRDDHPGRRKRGREKDDNRGQRKHNRGKDGGPGRKKRKRGHNKRN